MSLLTEDCQLAICEWLKEHKSEIPTNAYSVSLTNDGNHKWVTDGTSKPKCWKRRAKATLDED